jgi:hypothetical protein
MSALGKVTYIVNRLQVNKVFTVDDFITETLPRNNVRVALDTLVAAGKIRKLDRGRYYKPQETIFGEMEPDIEQVLSDLVYDKNRKLIGYLTGDVVFAQLGLTTQITTQILIGVKKYRRSVKRGRYTVTFVEQPNPIKKEDIELFRLLDALRFIKDIPATTPEEAVERMLFLAGRLSEQKQKRLVDLALNYKPYVRALLGAIMEKNQADEVLVTKLRKSLNGLTTYKLHISEEIIPAAKWNIKKEKP